MIHSVPETGSTNADLLARIDALEPMPEGDWLVTDRQTAGRGRMGREWQDGAGNFMGSTTVHLREGDAEAASLALVAGLAAHDAVSGFGADAMLKWPNDLLMAGAKVAGILLERSGSRLIVGVGVNLVSAPKIPGRPTTSLAAQGIEVGRDAFADALAESFLGALDAWRSEGLPCIIERWLAAAHPQGTPLTVSPAGEPRLTGTFAGLDSTGALRLALASGEMRVIQAGDVMLAASAGQE